MLEFWKKIEPYMPPCWASHDYLETLIMAASVMVTIPAPVFFIAVQQCLIAGWGAGGLKG